MENMKTQKTRKILLALLSFVLLLSLICLSPVLQTNKTSNAIADDIPPSISLHKVDSPIAGRTSWANENRPLGFAIYLNDVSFAVNQVHLQNGMTADNLAKISFTRGETTQSTPVLICATQDGGYNLKSCFVFFFGGALANQPINEYQNGDKAIIEEGCILKCAEGSYLVSEKIEYEYLNGVWKACSYSSTATWKNVSVKSERSDFTRPAMGMGITTYSNNKDITAQQTDGIQNSVFDLKKITLFRQGEEFHPTRIIGATYTMNYMFLDLPITDKFVSGDMLKIEEGFSFIYNDTRYTYAETEVYVFTGSSWQVPSLNVSVESMNVALNENIDAVFTFKLPIANVENGTNSIFVTVSGEETVVDLNTCVEKERDEKFVTFAVFIELNPTLLTADIQFYFRSIVGDNISFSQVYHKTIKEYCEYFIQNGTEKQVDLVKALLNYGGYSQVFFNVNTKNLANKGLYQTNDPIDDVVVSDENIISQTSASGLTFKSIQLYLETTPTLRFYFTIDGEYTIDNYAFKLTTNKDFELTPEYDEESGRYYVDAENIPAKLISKTFTISVENTTDNTVYTIESSINCYIKMALANPDTTTEKANMLKALYVYGVCADAFAN